MTFLLKYHLLNLSNVFTNDAWGLVRDKKSTIKLINSPMVTTRLFKIDLS